MSDAAHHLLAQAAQARRESRLVDAKQHLVEAVALCRQEGDGAALGRALAASGQIERDLKNIDAALHRYEQAVAIYRATGDMLRLAHAVRHLGDIHQDAGRADLAEPCYEEALDLYRRDERTPPLDLANAVRGLALLKGSAGESEQARSLWTEARDLYLSVNVTVGVAESSRRLALLTQESPGDPARP